MRKTLTLLLLTLLEMKPNTVLASKLAHGSAIQRIFMYAIFVILPDNELHLSIFLPILIIYLVHLKFSWY